MNKTTNNKANGTRRENGTGSISYNSTRGKWSAKIATGEFTKNGAPAIKTVWCNSEKEAEKELKKLISLKRKGQVSTSRIILSKYMEEWLLETKLDVIKGSSYDALDNIYRNYIKASAIGRTQLSELDSSTIQKFLNSFQLVLSQSTMRKIRSIIKQTFDYAEKEELISRNPAKNIVIPKGKDKEKSNIYTKDQLSTLINQCFLKDDKGLFIYEYAPIFSFITNTGLRESEAISLTMDKIFTKDGQKFIKIDEIFSRVAKRDESGNKLGNIYKVTSPKTKSSNRVIPLNKNALVAIDAMASYKKLLGIESKFVFCKVDGSMISTSSLIKRFGKITIEANLPNNHIHSLRHYFITSLHYKGADVKTISKIVGHNDTRTTLNIYTHVPSGEDVKAVNLLD